MLQIFDSIFDQFLSYKQIDFYLEIIAVVFGLLSVWFAKKNHIAVYPLGIISTLIFVYLLYKFHLIGDMMINAYYFLMSIYGWYIWTKKKDGHIVCKITYMNAFEKRTAIILFISSLFFVSIVYYAIDRGLSLIPVIDILTTALFFVGMWLMANKKIENWILWIIADLISIPLYFYKGMVFTSIQYLIFTVIAVFGYLSWEKIYKSRMLTTQS
tara:strand:- start:1224 stop:1862 length:639 start_codon:yes stop_codon:yes gene_type:complete